MIQGKQKQTKRTNTFLTFCKADSGILLCTNVAARGLDIPAVDWIVQYDPPDSTEEYIHRVGRTARGEGRRGRALLFLRPEEYCFLFHLRYAKVLLNELEFEWSKVADMQVPLENLVEKDYSMNVLAKKAFKGYVYSYQCHHLKKVFNVGTLDLAKVAASFGLKVVPPVGIRILFLLQKLEVCFFCFFLDKYFRYFFTDSCRT